MSNGIRVVLVMNRKGGSGKSTVCRALASAAAVRGGNRDDFRHRLLTFLLSLDGRRTHSGEHTSNRGLATHVLNALKEATELLDEIDRMITVPMEVA